MNSKMFHHLALMILMWAGSTHANAQCTELYGMTPYGGKSDLGSIFKVNENGLEFTSVYHFKGLNGESFEGLCKAKNGKLYGIFRYGGNYSRGILFEWDPATNECIVKYSFKNHENGYGPFGNLIPSSNGKIYGTAAGGINNSGVIFEWDPATDNYSKIIDINQDCGISNLLQADNGKFYALENHHLSSYMTLIELDLTNKTKIDKKLEFDKVENGKYLRSLIQGKDGKLYGVTAEGGIYDYGVLFSWDPVTNTFEKKLDFDGNEYGGNPCNSLMQASNDKLYGTTAKGGAYKSGVIYEWDPKTNIFKNKYSFDSATTPSSIDAFYLKSTLIQAGNGRLYGAKKTGEHDADGILFEFDPNSNTYNQKYTFNDTIVMDPRFSFALAENGKLYGYGSNLDEANFNQVLFEWDPVSNIYKKKLDIGILRDEAYPEGSLIQADNGRLYGMTKSKYYCSVVFEYDPLNMIFSRKTFEKLDPIGSLMQAGNGKFYGIDLTYVEDANYSILNLIEYDSTFNNFTKRIHYICYDNNKSYASVMQAQNGKFYLLWDIAYDLWCGMIFEFDPIENIYKNKFNFNGIQSGKAPKGTMIQVDDSTLYGVTSSGGVYDCGVIFTWDLDRDSLTKKYDFNNIDGKAPYGSLMQTKNGKIYGMTANGGTHDDGVLFEWDPATNVYIKKLDFNGAENGSHPYGSLTQSDNGKLYGMTTYGGVYDYGVIFEWDPISNTYTKLLDFNGLNGRNPKGDLTKVEHPVFDTINVEACESYISPSGRYNWTLSGRYRDTIPGSSGCDSVITVNLTVNQSTTSMINATVCEKYTSPGGKQWTESGEYTDTIPNFAGCDSIITVLLSVVSADTSVTQHEDVLHSNASEATYQWINCDNGILPVEGASQQSFTAGTSGIYAVIVSQNGCTDTSSCYVVIKTGMVSNTFKQHIALYPNPSDGTFFIDIGRVYLNVAITVSTTDGRVLLHKNNHFIQKTRITLDEPPGMYLVTVDSDEQRAVFCVVKKY